LLAISPDLEYARSCSATNVQKGYALVGWINRKRDVAAASSRTLNRPKARSEELVVEEVGDELLVYDQVHDHAHSLGTVAAKVWRACDGDTSVEVLAHKLSMDDETVARALEQLDACHLIDRRPDNPGMTRRDVTFKTAKLGAAAASLPLVVSIAAPVPAMASTQLFCLGLGCVKDCGDCHMAKCACCGPGNATTSATKICTQDCSDVFCNDVIRSEHCGTVSPSDACNTSDARLKDEISTLALPRDW
jgi:DNA-binding MarR family transcriptional regulator